MSTSLAQANLLISLRTTKIDVEDEAVIIEVMIDIAAALEVRGRQTESIDIRRAHSNRVWYSISREEPYSDRRGSPLHGVDTSPVGVESCTRVRWSGRLNGAASDAATKLKRMTLAMLLFSVRL